MKLKPQWQVEGQKLDSYFGRSIMLNPKPLKALLPSEGIDIRKVQPSRIATIHPASQDETHLI